MSKLSKILAGAAVIVLTAFSLSGCTASGKGIFTKEFWQELFFGKGEEVINSIFDHNELEIGLGPRPDVQYNSSGFKLTGSTAQTRTTILPLSSGKGATMNFSADVASNTAVNPVGLLYYYENGTIDSTSGFQTIAIAAGKASNSFTVASGYKITGVRFINQDATSTSTEFKNVVFKGGGTGRNQFERLLVSGDVTSGTLPKHSKNDEGFTVTIPTAGTYYSSTQLVSIPTRTSLKFYPMDTALSSTGTMSVNVLYTEVDTYVIKTKAYAVSKNTNILFEPETDFFHVIGYYFSFTTVPANSTVTFNGFAVAAHVIEV